MVYHILNGDSLAYSFPYARLEGDIIVVREGLIDGDLSGDDLHDFWRSRARYMGLTEAEYQDKVVSEFEQIMNAPDESNSIFGLSTTYSARLTCGLLFLSSIVCQ